MLHNTGMHGQSCWTPKQHQCSHEDDDIKVATCFDCDLYEQHMKGLDCWGTDVCPLKPKKEPIYCAPETNGGRQEYQDHECEYCGKPLVPKEDEPPSMFNKRRYCNRSCSGHNNAAKTGPKQCPICKIYFRKPPSMGVVEWGKRKCCSISCSNIYRARKNSTRNRKIYDLAKTMKHKDIGEKFGISRTAVTDIVSRLRKESDCTVKGKQKLKEGDYQKIRLEYRTGSVTQDDLALRYNISPTTVNKIVNNKYNKMRF